MSRNLIPVYDGAINGNCIGSFYKDGYEFSIIRPGYDSQGKRRTQWTQFIYQGIPVFEVKIDVDLRQALKLFDTKWTDVIEPSRNLLDQGLKNAMSERRKKFKDGKTGIEPAPALRPDGKGDGVRRPR